MTRNSGLCLSLMAVLALGVAGNAWGQVKPTQVARGDAYYLQRAQIDAAHAAEHARLAEEYLAMKEPIHAAREHATAIRTGVHSARRSHSMISDIAKKDAEISKKLTEIASKEKYLLALADRIDPPIVIPPIRRSAQAQYSPRLRFSQSYYFDGEGHFID